MKKIFAFLFGIVLLLPGCSFDTQVLTPTPVPLEPTVRTILAPKGTLTVDEIVPNVLPTTTDPQFYEAYITPEQSGEAGRSRFPAGTKQLFAVLNYRNMREGLTVKREWYLDDRLWLTREEPWDFAKYGASGIMRDVSIYDLDAGLPTGKYKLIVFIDGVAQPIGRKVIESSAETILGFEILPVNEATSPNGQFKATSLVERLVLTDANGNQSDLFVGREIAAVAWLPDSQHLLVVDRDRSKQVHPNLSVGVRDDLWIVDISSLKTKLVHASDTRVSGNSGLVISPDGRYIASIEGSGFGDACFLDARQIFFEIASDYSSVKPIKQEQFAGIPKTSDGMMYPVSAGSSWQGNTQYSVPLNGTCGSFDPDLIGSYLFDVPGLKAELQSPSATPLGVGDLGWGEVHGVVADAVTGIAIPNATVTCTHSSSTSQPPLTCSGSFVTGIPGGFIFKRVFFHDTDTIKLTVTAPGYQPQEFTQTGFTTNDLMVTFSLVPLP